jgi:hypothetical protein
MVLMMKMMSPSSRLLVFLIAVLISHQGYSNAPRPKQVDLSVQPSMEDLALVKGRTVRLLQGGSSTGAYRSAITVKDNAWCREFLDTPFTPVDKVEADPVGTTDRLRYRAEDLRRLAVIFNDPNGDYYRDARITDRISEELMDLLPMFESSAAKDGNWYVWLIALPRALGAIGLLMENELPAVVLDDLIKRMSNRLEKMVLTGANASWEARNHIFLALLTDDLERLTKASERVFVEVRYGNVNGVLEDYAYLFHGKIPYGGGYGAGFAQTVSQFIYLFSGTPWALPEKKAALITNLLLEHSRWYAAGYTLDFHITGRIYESHRNTSQILDAMLFLSRSSVDRADDLAGAAKALILDGGQPTGSVAAWADDLLESTVEPKGPEGFRFWPSSEMGAYVAEDYQIGFRQYSSRVQDYEYLILQGPEGWNLAMGAVNILRPDGKALWYANGELLPEINMEHLSNVTTREGAQPINPRDKFADNIGYSLNYGTSDFSGGCGWMDGGVAGFILEPPYGDVVAKKSLHFFDGGYWSLGTGISSTLESAEQGAGKVRTNILQWVVESEEPVIRVAGGVTHSVQETPTKMDGVKWLWFSEMGVVFTEPTDVWCSRKGPVVTLWLDHGETPDDARYAFAVLPVTSPRRTEAFATKMDIKPDRIDNAVHAVRTIEGERKSAVFFEPSSALGFDVPQPLIVHQYTTDSGSVVTLQNPLHTNERIELGLNLGGAVTYQDTSVTTVNNLQETIDGIYASTTLGRIHRLATGDLGKRVEPEPREDLSDLHRFEVEADSTHEETILTVIMPKSWRTEDWLLSVHGRLGHHLAYLNSSDIVKELSGDVVQFRWDRSLPLEPVKGNSRLLQRSGDFRLWYEADMKLAIDYFSVPLFDEDGNEVEDPDYRADTDSPYRERLQRM